MSALDVTAATVAPVLFTIELPNRAQAEELRDGLAGRFSSDEALLSEQQCPRCGQSYWRLGLLTDVDVDLDALAELERMVAARAELADGQLVGTTVLHVGGEAPVARPWAGGHRPGSRAARRWWRGQGHRHGGREELRRRERAIERKA